MSMAKNLMQGDQHAIPFVLKMKDGTLITDAMVKTVALNLGNLSRQYPGDVTYKNGQWLFPVTQAQTFAMRGSVEPQARVEFLNDDIFGGAGEPVELQNALNKGIIGTDGTTAAKQNAPTMQTELQGAILVIVVAAGVEFSAEGAVRYDEPQQLTDEQKAQAQQNIGAKAVTPDYQENDPESPNYIQNRNGGYYTWDEENPIGRYRVYNGQTFPNALDFAGGRPDETAVYCAVVMRGTIKTQFVRRFNYFLDADNAAELGFYLHSWNPSGPSYRVTYVPDPTDITDIKVYDVMPVAFPRDLLEIPLASQRKPGLIAVQDVEESNGDIFGCTDATIQKSTSSFYNGRLRVPKPWVQVPSFEYSESGGIVPNNVAPDYARNGFVVESSNYLAGVLGIEDTDFPIQIVGASMVYGNGLPYVPCQFFTKTGKSGYFNWRVNGKAEDAGLNPSSDSDIFVVRFTQNDGTWSADKTYAEIKQAMDDGKVVQGVVNKITAIAIDQPDANQVEFILNYVEPNVQDTNITNVLVSVLDIIVSPNGISVSFSNEYRSIIAPMQTIMVVKNNDGFISKLVGPVENLEDALTYIVKFTGSEKLRESSFSTLTVLFRDQILPSRYYYSNVVMTPDSTTSSMKIDFVFKSADATKTLTGSVTMPNGWDGETPLDETWTYTETDALDGAVRYDEAQTLTDVQKNQALANLGALPVHGSISSTFDYNALPAMYNAGLQGAIVYDNTGSVKTGPQYPLLVVFGRQVYASANVDIFDANGDYYTASIDLKTNTIGTPGLKRGRLPVATADNVGKVPVAAKLDEDANTYGYEMKDLADPRIMIFHVTGKGTTAEPYAMDITLEELTAAIAAGNAVFATLDTVNQYSGDTSTSQKIVYQYQETRTYTTATQYIFVSLLTPMSDTATSRIYLLRINTETGAIMGGVSTILKTYNANFYKKADGAWACTKTVHQLGAAINAGCNMLIYSIGTDRRYYTCTKNIYANNANDVVECVCREGNTLYTATITEAGVTMTEETVLPVSSDGTSFILNSSTADSTKRFKITVDDSGTLTATEVDEDATVVPT